VNRQLDDLWTLTAAAAVLFGEVALVLGLLTLALAGWALTP